MRCLATNDRAETDDRIKLSRLCESQCQQRNLESARHPIHANVRVLRAEALQTIERALDESRRDQLIPAAGHDGEAKRFSVETSFVHRWLQPIRPRELNSYYVSQYRRCSQTHQVDEFCWLCEPSSACSRSSISSKSTWTLRIASFRTDWPRERLRSDPLISRVSLRSDSCS